jgi:hypothetical protein
LTRSTGISSWSGIASPSHYSIYNGVSIFPTRTSNARRSENNVVVELARVLEERMLPSGSRPFPVN